MQLQRGGKISVLLDLRGHVIGQICMLLYLRVHIIDQICTPLLALIGILRMNIAHISVINASD